MDIQWNTDNTISIKPPKRPKKLTGTRFASVLGLNRWNTPFQMFCEITKVHSMPFEETKYTKAGKAIEPKQIQYMRDAYAMDDLVDPHDEYGPDPLKATYGNFFSHPILGGMWDAITRDEDGTVTSVLEFKTTKRAEDWEDDVPEYYALQAAMYAWLLDCDDVIMVVSFLEEKDYEDPDKYVPSAENTAVRDFKVSERYPNFEEDYIEPALDWWAQHIETGDSPAFDEKDDKEYLDALRRDSINPESDISALLTELADLTHEVSIVEKQIEKKQKRIKSIKEQMKKYALENIGDKPKYIFGSDRVTCTLTKSSSKKIDEAALKKDGLFEKYSKDSESTKFNVKFN